MNEYERHSNLYKASETSKYKAEAPNKTSWLQGNFLITKNIFGFV